MRKLAFLFLTAAIALAPNFIFGQPGGSRGPAGPRIAPEDLKPEMGIDKILDHETFQKFSYQGPEVYRDAYLADLEFVKFCVENFQTENTNIYFMNTEIYRAHPPWMRMVGINTRCRGAITFLPRLTNPSGTAGLYVVDFEPFDSYSCAEIEEIFDLLIAKIPIIKGKCAFHPLEGNLRKYESEKEKYKTAGIAVYLDSDLYGDISYLPLNSAKSFGKLRIMTDDGRPSPRDIVIYKTLPNQMPRVAGVITETRQTPLSHVNLRAVQDKIPNAFIRQALKDKTISSLVGELVSFEVTPQGYKIARANKAEVDNHFANLRPPQPQFPSRDLTAKAIRPLAEINFRSSDAYGVKTSNLATMRTFKETGATVPDGMGVPFFFYDEFMKHNQLYESVDVILATPQIQQDREKLDTALKDLRNKIKASEMPEWMMKAIADAQNSFAEGTSIRCRSSTNNEDLPGFSGAGLYDSFTHKTTEGHLSKSIKQVYASLWNFRAFEERAFYRIDHKTTAMGVLIHPNFKGEIANGVAVSDDVLYESKGNYYLNTQPGEDLVTNPNANSSPEELLLGWWERDGYEIVRKSDAVGKDEQLLSKQQLNQLRTHIGRIHHKFRKLYQKSEDDQFAMEIEYKIDEEGNLVIKQARPWVY
ncbi:MAG: PEP/pyruvate-binding domain-containing protein [Mariniblastus sp.]|nr:PEP/pyruvate-binding domain-containing protein [Mariniblastus sp.]